MRFLRPSCSLREIYLLCKFIDSFGNEVILQRGRNVFFISNRSITNIKRNFGCFNEQMDMIGLRSRLMRQSIINSQNQ
ncbi:Uncharacterised protein [Vibrio cholerae]|nr:Uncharacterised protein [Vibrio cholerae]